MKGSVQLRAYLGKRRRHMPPEQAAAEAGISLTEARLIDADEARGLLADIDLTEPEPATSEDIAMREPLTTSISVNGGPQVPIDLSKGIDHPDNADARGVMAEVVGRGLGHNKPPEKTMSDTIAADQLRLFIERIERLEEEKKGMADDIRDVYAEAKGQGYDAKTMRVIVRLRKMDKNARDEAEYLLDTYKAALGLA